MCGSLTEVHGKWVLMIWSRVIRFWPMFLVPNKYLLLNCSKKKSLKQFTATANSSPGEQQDIYPLSVSVPTGPTWNALGEGQAIWLCQLFSVASLFTGTAKSLSENALTCTRNWFACSSFPDQRSGEWWETGGKVIFLRFAKGFSDTPVV